MLLESFRCRLGKCKRIATGIVVPALSQGQAADRSGWLLASSHLILWCLLLHPAAASAAAAKGLFSGPVA